MSKEHQTKRMVVPPDGSSIYYGMFTQGIKQVRYDIVVRALSQTSHKIREKDVANYGRGYYKSSLYKGSYKDSLLSPRQESSLRSYDKMDYTNYPYNPFDGQPEITNRYVPCNAKGIPLIKGSKGCMELSDAKAFTGCKYIGENTKGCKFIVIDVDGDHGDSLHPDTYKTFQSYISQTHTLIKPGYDEPISYHLTFKVDRVIPTMHFSNAHIDIIGNKCNSIRYFKNKEWNGIEPMVMTEEIWNDIKGKVQMLERN